MPHRLLLCLAVASTVLLAGAATAAPPPTQVHGAYCTPTGCAGADGSAAARVAAFGLTLGITLQLGRRRRSALP